ncbi:MAG: GntR family transcriptional regulator [Umezawaea sp.]
MPEPFTTKGDFAYATLREKVLSGEFGPGEVLNQATLARTFGISTTPLREALRRLKSEGLVELDAHRDARVTELTATEARDLLEVRRALDPLAVSLAATRRTDADIAEIHAAARGLAPLRRDPGVEALVAHRRFHSALYRASHNVLLISALDGLWDKADRYRRLGLEVPRGKPERDRTTLEHRRLVDHVVAGDAEGAAAVMHAHIAASLGATAASRLDKASRAHR